MIHGNTLMSLYTSFPGHHFNIGLIPGSPYPMLASFLGHHFNIGFIPGSPLSMLASFPGHRCQCWPHSQVTNVSHCFFCCVNMHKTHSQVTAIDQLSTHLESQLCC